MNLTKVFEKMTLEQIETAPFSTMIESGMPLELLKPFERIWRQKMLPRDIYNTFFTEPDDLFTAIYGNGGFVNGERQYIYPFGCNKVPEGISEVHGPIGIQTSKWHHETMQQHVALVAANLVDHEVDPWLAVALATLHDVGKKYTISTNKRGEISFYGHARVSAFIASYWLKQLNVDERLAKTIVATVYAHMDAHELWKEGGVKDWKTGEMVDHRARFWEELVAFCGDEDLARQIMKLIDTFSKCDEGVDDLSLVEDRIKRGERLILGMPQF